MECALQPESPTVKRLHLLLTLPISLLLGGYGIALVVNLKDVPASPAAERMQSLLSDRPAVADAHNAYVYAFAFDMEKGESPVQWGRNKLDWANSHSADSLTEGASASSPGDTSGKTWSATRDRTPNLRKFSSGYDSLLGADDSELQAWLGDEAWLLERYTELTDYSGWREVVPKTAAAPFAPFSEIMEGQKLLMAKALYLAARGNPEAVAALLQRDLRFWRMVLAESDLLITKMIAAAAVKKHFELGNQALRRLQAAGVSSASGIPELWRKPLTVEERSLARVMAGEWRYGNQLMEEMTHNWGGTTPLWSWFLMKPFFQLQDVKNRRAEILVTWGKPLDVPLEALPQVLESAQAEPEKPANRIGLYNLSGRLFFGADRALPEYADYVPRVADLEGVRRAALLAALLRSGDSSQISALGNPYTGEPLPLAGDKSVVFVGLTEGERGRHDFPI